MYQAGFSPVDGSAEFDAEVNKKLGLQPVYTFSPVIDFKEVQGGEKFECKVCIDTLEFTGDKSNCTNDQNINKPADKLALLHARHYLSQHNWMLNPLYKTNKKFKLNSEKQKIILENVYEIPRVNRNSSGWAVLVNEMGQNSNSVMYNCVKYMSPEILAMYFKDLVYYVTHGRHRFITQTYQIGHFTGYFSVLQMDCAYEGLAPMLNENQAEQSAAEAFLRIKGYIPKVKKEDYLIQPYQGGQSMCIPGMKVDKPYIFTSTLLTDILEAFLEPHVISPRYHIQETIDIVCNVYGELEPKVKCLLSISGKIFESQFKGITRIATQFAAEEALKYFGISNFQERMELRKHIHINRYSFAEYLQTMSNLRPSVCRGWLSAQYCRPEINSGVDSVESVLKSALVMNNIPTKMEFIREVVQREMQRTPSFQGLDLIDMEDLCVADVDTNNPSVFTVGNSQFSIKMFCEEGKLYSEKSSVTVQVLPGHNIRKLKCEYRVSVPSLEIHIIAIKCFDLCFPNPPLPVVTSCGVVVLSHDPEKNPGDVFVLVRRRTFGTFDSKIYCLAVLLTSLVESNSLCDIAPAEFTEGIEKWRYKDVKLLSNLTMDSVCELMSMFPKYDPRWNELFAVELPAPLEEIQDACLHELRRREEENVSVEDEDAAWELPNSEFVNHFETIGIHLEDTIFCMKRALNATCVKVNLFHIESFLSIDIPRKTDKCHSVGKGAVSRFYIWGSRNGFFTHRNIINQAIKGYNVSLKGPPLESGMRKYLYSFDLGDMSTTLQNLENIELVNSDGSKRNYIQTAKYRIKIAEPKAKGTRKKNNKVATSSCISDEIAGIEGQTEIEDIVVPGLVKCGEDGGSKDSEILSVRNNIKIPLTRDPGKHGELIDDVMVDYDDSSVDNDMPIIPLPGDRNFTDYQSSLEEYCRQKKWKRPQLITKMLKQHKKKKGVNFVGIATFGPYVVQPYYRCGKREESASHTAKKALELLGYLPQTGREWVKVTTDKVPIPGDEDFRSYRHSWKKFRLSKRFGCPRYACNFDPVHITFRGILTFGNTRIIAEKTSKSRDEGLARVSYTALQRYGFLKGVPFEAGYKQGVFNKCDEDVVLDCDKELDGDKEFKEEMESNDAEDLDSNKLKGFSKAKVRSDEMGSKEKSKTQMNRKRKAEDMAKPVMDNQGTQTLTHDKIKTAVDFKEHSTKTIPLKQNPRFKSFVSDKSRWMKFRKSLPARDAYQYQCTWMKLDVAIDICPILKIISQTSQFKNELRKCYK